MAEKKDEKYVAYVSCYTRGSKVGIRVYDVDMEKGVFLEKEGVEISNSSYVTISHNRKYLYSITDYGVEGIRSGKTVAWKTLHRLQSTECAAAICLRITKTVFCSWPAITTARSRCFP